MTMGTRFGEIVSFHIGGGWGQEDPSSEESNPAYVIRGTDIPGARHGDVANVPLRFHKPGTLAKRQLQAGDIVFESSGGSKGQPVGRALLITDSLLSKFDEPVICASFCKMIRPDTTRADPAFLYYTLLDDYSNGTLSEYQVQSTGITNFQWKTFLQHRELILPPIGTQHEIGRVLETVDDLIENNRRRIEVLEQMAQAIYREWFVHFRFPGHEHATFVDSPLGPIPEDWKIRPFSDIATFTNGFAFKPSHWSDSGRPIIKIKELKNGVTRDTPRCHESEINVKFWIQPGDLLFSWSADLGVYRWSGEPGLLNQHLFVVQPTTQTSSGLIQHALAGALPKFWDRAQGTTMRHIKRSALTEVTTVVPSATVDSDFTNRVGPLDELGLRLVQTNRELEAMRDLLLPRLVSGEVDVSQLDLDALSETVS